MTRHNLQQTIATMEDFSYDYEFVFNDSFSQEVFDQCPIVDTDNTLQFIVENIVANLSQIQQIQTGIRCISCFGKHDDQTIKITVINSSWNP